MEHTRLTFEVSPRDLPWPVGMDFVGQYAGTNFYCFHIVSRILKAYPNVTTIVELGTFAGTMSMYLGLWGLRLGVPVHTFDIEPAVSRDVHHVLDALKVQRHVVDEFSKEGLREIMACFENGPGYIFMDGGDKQREFATLAPILPAGTVISVHDWLTEVHELNGNIAQLYFEGDDWLAHDARLATVVKLGTAEDMTRQTTREDVQEIIDKWIEVIGEQTERA